MSDFTDIMPSIVAQHMLNEATSSAAEHAARALHERRRPASEPTGGSGQRVANPGVKPPPTSIPGPGRSVSK